MEDFYKPKIFYADITQELCFCECQEVMFCNNTTYFITSENPLPSHFVHYLNSKLIDWYYRTLSVQLGEKAVRMFSIYVLNIPIPLKADGDIYNTFKLSDAEIHYIEDREI